MDATTALVSTSSRNFGKFEPATFAIDGSVLIPSQAGPVISTVDAMSLFSEGVREQPIYSFLKLGRRQLRGLPFIVLSSIPFRADEPWPRVRCGTTEGFISIQVTSRGVQGKSLYG